MYVGKAGLFSSRSCPLGNSHVVFLEHLLVYQLRRFALGDLTGDIEPVPATDVAHRQLLDEGLDT